MEGCYYYGQGTLGKAYMNTILHAKRKWKICSLSGRCDAPLMWSHYADGHQGIAIGLELPRMPDGTKLHELRYTDSLDFEEQPDTDATAKWILTRKLSFWNYECEHRVLTNDSFVPIEIREVLLGCKASCEDEELLTGLLKTLHPEVAVRRFESDAIVHVAPNIAK